jgi:hypothetical protein
MISQLTLSLVYNLSARTTVETLRFHSYSPTVALFVTTGTCLTALVQKPLWYTRPSCGHYMATAVFLALLWPLALSNM